MDIATTFLKLKERPIVGYVGKEQMAHPPTYKEEEARLVIHPWWWKCR